MNPASKKGFVPLDRALSKLGIASRTVARHWILSGRLKVNGVVKQDPGLQVWPERTKFELDGKPLARASAKTILLYKPRGVVTTRSDEKGRPTVFSLLKETDQNFHAAGRLDMASTGLLLLTNDTRLSAWLTDPENKVPRIYLVTVRGRVTEEDLAALDAKRVTLRKASGKESHLTVELEEGKNRQVRKMFEETGHEVTQLKRVSFGGLELGSLQPGEYREIPAAELRKVFPAFFRG